MEPDLVDRAHEPERSFGAKFLGECREPFQVAEHHRDVPALAFDLVALGKDLLGEALMEVALDLGDLVVGGEVFDGWFGIWGDG
jgi:hypothetical protein